MEFIAKIWLRLTLYTFIFLITYGYHCNCVQVLGHEVKELGTHILVCEVTYTTASGEKLNFRKFFKFQVCGVKNKVKLLKCQ